LIFLFFDNEEIHDCSHMTYHMMWDHRSRLSKSWLEKTRRIMLGHIYIAWYSYRKYEVDTWWKHELHMNIRVGLFIISMDHEDFI